VEKMCRQRHCRLLRLESLTLVASSGNPATPIGWYHAKAFNLSALVGQAEVGYSASTIGTYVGTVSVVRDMLCCSTGRGFELLTERQLHG
jgi:hypothetical protein